MVHLPFADRREAGLLLVEELARHTIPRTTVVLALARGGVPIGFEVAKRLGLPLDVLVARKLGVPWQLELAMGAVAGSARVLDQRLIQELEISAEEVRETLVKETAEMKRREELYRDGRPSVDITHHHVIIVDDGIATGNTLIAAIRHARNLRALKVNVAVPVGSQSGCAHIRKEAEGATVICLAMPPDFGAVGQWYVNFSQVSDGEVRHLLAENYREVSHSRTGNPN
jgi:putative phosphoribosyl transferase